jgi:hypothetical protein
MESLVLTNVDIRSTVPRTDHEAKDDRMVDEDAMEAFTF